METNNFALKKKALLTMAIAAVCNSAVHAESTEFEEVVVWGTKVSSSSESVYAEDMALKQADHMSDLLRDIPGVDVGGTHSVNQRINIRGMGETKLDIRLDGASQHANMFHHIGNLTLNPDIIKSADIQVGNNSVAQSGLGGGVYFETKDAMDLLRYDENFGVRIYGGAASNKSEQASITLYGMLSDKVDALIYGHGVSRGNFEDGNGVETFGAEGDVYNVLAKLGFEPNDLHRFEISADMYRDEGDYSPRPDMSGSANETISQDLLLPTEYDRNTFVLSYELTGEEHRGKVSVYSSQTEVTRDESKITVRWPTDRLSENSATNRNLGANAKFESDLALGSFDNTLLYGVDYIDQNSTSEYGGNKFMDETAISRAIFLEDTLYLTPSILVTAGIRFEDYERKATTGNKTFDDITWSLGSEWEATDNVTLFVNTRSLFKGPELLETFIAYQDVAVLAEDIKAETGQNTQGGVRFDKQIGDHYIGANLTIFKTTIEDYITEEYQRATQGYLIYNLGDMETKGAEVSATYGYKLFHSKLSYSQLENKDKTNGGPILDGNGRSADMGDSFALTLDYQSETLDTQFGWTSILVLDEDNVVEGTPEKEGYDVHNLYAQWRPSSVEDLAVTFGIDNVFDELYISHASRTGYSRTTLAEDYEPGRNYKLSLAYQF
ncbi:TonB-dependent siderophore receptor [Vibrio sp. 99-70-13A1]|uniref:TonB-dependent siderophore receptor n=1 Tax=Vibrio sp. 99-70-13A1 TaxID=2607601 RepID=UPI0014939A24|nr:TonB-dependent siderophore receptor [Vibrio sp. 99-70-13A1]NOH97559.1 TonB-dependent siderophore receptor [Vibrio sp. 99-70-13A1]